MNRLEQRVRKIEEKAPALHEGFMASVNHTDPPLDLNDPRLKEGVKAFTCTIHGTGKQEERAEAFISPWFKVLFIGGTLEQWEKKLQGMRQEAKYFDADRRAMEWLHFNADGTEPSGPRPSGLIFEFGRSDKEQE